MARDPLSCGAQCSRITLIVFNILFMHCSFLVLYSVLAARRLKKVKEEIRPTFKDIKISDYDLCNLLNSLAIIFIIIGAIIIFFPLIGFVGAVCYVRVALAIYATLIGISLALELSGVILFFLPRGDYECCKVESERLDNSTKLRQASETCNIQGNNYNTLLMIILAFLGCADP